MASFSTCLRLLFCWWPPQTTMYYLSMKKLDLYPDMTKTSETWSLGSYERNSVHLVLQKICICLFKVFKKVIHHCMSVTELLNIKMFLLCTEETVVMTDKTKNKISEVKERPGRDTWKNEIQMVTVFRKTVNPQMKVMIRSDQMAEMEVLLSDWLKCPSEEQDESKDGGDGDTEWSDEEEDLGVSEMSSENKELWESFFDNNDPYNPLYLSCSTEDKLKASASEGPVSSCNQEEDETEWNKEEDSDWSDEEDLEMSGESRDLWESFNSDPYNPLCFSCLAEVKMKEIEQNHTPLCPTASETVEHNPEQSTKKRAKKVRFTEEVTTHILEAWGCAGQAARDGSCWMELARDRERFKRRVQKAGEVISPCLTAQHRARVFRQIESLQ